MTKDTHDCHNHDHWDHCDQDRRDHFPNFFLFFLNSNFEKYCDFFAYFENCGFFKNLLLDNPEYLRGQVLRFFQVAKNSLIAKPKYFQG